jgi:hypothetical protein
MKVRRHAAIRGAALAVLLAAAPAFLSACAVREKGLAKVDLDRFRASAAVKTVRRTPPPFAVHSPWEVTLPMAGVASGLLLPYVPEVTSRLGVFESAGEAVGDAGLPAFGIFSAEGAVAYASARRRGSSLVSPLRLDDPAEVIRQNFAYTLSATGPGMGGEIAGFPELLPPPSRRTSTVLKLSRSADPEELAALKARVGDSFVLDFRTTDWGLLYYTWDWDRYRVRYSAAARLVDLTGPGTPTVAWEGRCQVLDDEYDRRPFLKDFLSDDGTLLRSRLLDAAEECSRQLWRKFAAAP